MTLSAINREFFRKAFKRELEPGTKVTITAENLAKLVDQAREEGVTLALETQAKAGEDSIQGHLGSIIKEVMDSAQPQRRGVT